MSLSSICKQVPNYYFVSILNSNLIFDYYRTFINCSVNIQINDIRMLPVIIPSQESLSSIEPLFHRAVEIRKHNSSVAKIDDSSVEELRDIEETIDGYVEHLYLINASN